MTPLPWRDRPQDGRDGGRRSTWNASRRAKVLSLVPLLLAAGCWADPGLERTGDPAIEITVGISPTPPMAGAAQLRVVVQDGGESLGPDARVQARVLPATAGADTPIAEAVSLVRRSDGGWFASVIFPEPGEARLEVEVVRTDGSGATLRVPVTVSRRPGI